MVLYIDDNTYGIEENHLPLAEKIVEQMQDFFSAGIGKFLFGSIGLELLFMLVVALLLLAQRRMVGIHVIPLLCYDFGTMLLLSGSDYRFFLLNIPLWMPIIYIMLKDEATWKQKKFVG